MRKGAEFLEKEHQISAFLRKAGRTVRKLTKEFLQKFVILLDETDDFDLGVKRKNQLEVQKHKKKSLRSKQAQLA